MVSFLNDNEILIKDQHGFIKNKSCLTNLLTFSEYISESIDKSKPVDVFYLDFRKAFDRVPLKLLLHKLHCYGIRGKLLGWVENWLCGRVQRVVLQGTGSEWTEVLSGVPHGSVLGPVLFTVYINDLGGDIISRILKFADDTKTFGRVSTWEEGDRLQNDLDKLFHWAENWGMSFNTEKCKVMHLGNKNFNREYFMGGQRLNTVDSERDLGVVVSNDMKVALQCAKACATANRMLGVIKRTFSSRSRDVIIPLYKAIVRPHLEYCVQAWRPHLKKDVELLEKVQHRATKCIEGLEGLRYEERLKSLGLPSLEYRRLRGDLIEVFKMYKGWSGLKFEDFFELAGGNLRGHCAKLYKKRFNLNWGKFCFSNRVVDWWNGLPGHVIKCETVTNFKVKLDKYFREERDML